MLKVISLIHTVTSSSYYYSIFLFSFLFLLPSSLLFMLRLTKTISETSDIWVLNIKHNICLQHLHFGHVIAVVLSPENLPLGNQSSLTPTLRNIVQENWLPQFLPPGMLTWSRPRQNTTSRLAPALGWNKDGYNHLSQANQNSALNFSLGVLLKDVLFLSRLFLRCWWPFGPWCGNSLRGAKGYGSLMSFLDFIDTKMSNTRILLDF